MEEERGKGKQTSKGYHTVRIRFRSQGKHINTMRTEGQSRKNDKKAVESGARQLENSDKAQIMFLKSKRRRKAMGKGRRKEHGHSGGRSQARNGARDSNRTDM